MAARQKRGSDIDPDEAGPAKDQNVQDRKPPCFKNI
jgi:hypothetical protein